jgi:glyoxylase-like metal-dependent hydrolase (beta-lactamase superfamily II)
LIYPFGSSLAASEAKEVAPGVLWMRMPLPFALDHINVWGLDEGDGWTIVDTGMQTAAAVAAWDAACVHALSRRPVKRVICTHMHRDHAGMAGWLTQRFGCRLWMTRLEYLSCRLSLADSRQELSVDAVRYYRAAGWEDDAVEHYRRRLADFAETVYPLPESYRRIADGEEIPIGSRLWRAVIGRGHSPEHLCLHCPELGLVISGDQVLPKISSNVSVLPMEPDADPLSDWLESLTSIQRRVDDEVLVLPAHNVPFRGLHARLGELTRGHEEALLRVHRGIARPKRAIDVFLPLYRRDIGIDQLGLATGESLAHLNCLIMRGLAVRELDDNQVYWYRATRA